MSESLAALRSYVTALDDREREHVPEHLVVVHVTHSNLSTQIAEIRLDKHLTVRSLRLWA